MKRKRKNEGVWCNGGTFKNISKFYLASFKRTVQKKHPRKHYKKEILAFELFQIIKTGATMF